MAGLSSEDLAQIDETLSLWRQGDVAFPDEFVFLHLADLRQPITDLSKELSDEQGPGVQGVPCEVEGVAILTQTCDLVRVCIERPYVEVSPLVRLPREILEDVEKCRRPNYAWIPAISSEGLVADLDRVMTIEKSLISNWERVEGCKTDEEMRQFARALARKRSRIAFPTDFTRAFAKLSERVRSKHKKPESEEGRMLRALREIRVRAAPSWKQEYTSVELSVWFIKGDDPPDLRQAWGEQLEKWKALVDWGNRFECEVFKVCELNDLTAQDYVESDPLDLDHLSAGGEGPYQAVANSPSSSPLHSSSAAFRSGARS